MATTTTETVQSTRSMGFGLPGGHEVILVIDDDEDVRKIVCALLAAKGYQVVTAKSGESGIAVAQQSNPHLILLDVQMPDITGFEVCKELRWQSKFKDTPILFITASDSTEDKIEGFNAGGTDYICKPLSGKELIARVQLHMEVARSRSQLRKKNSLLEGIVASQTQRLNQVRHGQTNILTDPSGLSEIRAAVRYVPILEAGGDFYEIVRLSEDSFGLFVADVSGHDLGVAYLTGALKALVLSFASEALTPADTILMLNSSLCRFLGAEQYVTACYAKVSRSQKTVEIASAGHPPSLFVSHLGSNTYIDLVGDVLGIHETIQPGVTSFCFEPKDRIYLYSDGLIESYRTKEGKSGSRAFGCNRLSEAIQKHQHGSLGRGIDDVVDELIIECDHSVDDDIVLLGFEC